ncbi:hypothetical protein, partial [Xanthomonas axonopodis]|uniref:hypothetical protein n=1 Tax=Xanthomonas axonopodis TaxID=53413 RepID=UPI00117F75FF
MIHAPVWGFPAPNQGIPEYSLNLIDRLGGKRYKRIASLVIWRTRNAITHNVSKIEGSIMRYIYIFITALVLTGFASASAKAEDTVVVCDTCTSLSQFQMAARGAVTGTNVNSEVLVVNPVTEQAIWISVLPRSGGGTRSQVSKDSPKEVLPGEPIILPESGGIIRGKQKLESLEAAAAPGYDFLNRDLTPDEKAEVGAVIKLSGKDTIIVLPPDDGSGYFSSYNGTIAEGTKLYVFNRVAESNGGLLKIALASRIRQLLKNRLAAYFGKQSRVCSVYNNGDSVCWQIDLACPSCNTSINLISP